MLYSYNYLMIYYYKINYNLYDIYLCYTACWYIGSIR